MKFAACYSYRASQPGLPHRERGVALITAVLVVAIAAIIGTSMMSRQNFDTQRTTNIIHRDQAVAYALGAEHWAGAELSRDALNNDYDHLAENWAYELPPLPIDGGYISGRLQDLQGRFNLNSVLDPIQAERLVRLCQSINVEPDFIPALQDWIDEDTELRDNGAEDESYTLLDPPYRAANRHLADTSELLLVRGVSVEDYNSLIFFVSALPENSPINVNTASARLIQSLAPDIAAPDVERIIALRADSPYQKVDTFVEDRAFAGKELSESFLGVSSSYFLLTADVVLGDASFTLQSVLRRAPEGRITVMQRRFGSPRERILTQYENNPELTNLNERS
ncbi:MAG: type II secretion system minor pseudopilin GspK [Xanthomonadales bacterium]|nr:type II secretion system minor pseudopilin GspK [Xanthomonadales bacterium]